VIARCLLACLLAVCGAADCISCAAAPPATGVVGGTWQPIADSSIPSATALGSAVATPGRVLLWGGSGPCNDNGACGDGAAFDASTRRFTLLATAGAPSPRYLHTAVFTGSRMLVWGGAGCGAINGSCGDGAAYDPQSDTWSPLAASGAPAPRGWHSAVWTGREMIVWGGEDAPSRKLLADGARLDLQAGAWRPLSASGAPPARRYHSALWTGKEMIIWGGDRSAVDDGGLADGARYDPVKDSWAPINSTGAPAGRWAHTSVWTGSAMIVWGGLGCGRDSMGPLACGDGAAYDPERDSWRLLSAAGAPSARAGHSAVWTGSRMIVFGGCGQAVAGSCADAFSYDLAADRWAVIKPAPPIAPRAGHVAAWTGSSMFLWGGLGAPPAEGSYRDGALFVP
jgi:N-acetylneuraminic acid mutarotase